MQVYPPKGRIEPILSVFIVSEAAQQRCGRMQMPRVNRLGGLTTSTHDQIKPPILALPLNLTPFIMLILLLAFSLFQSYANAGQGSASLELRAVSACGDQDSRRSIWGIVWSCLTTIFLCTWVSLHPNVAFRPEKPNACWSERWIWDPLHHFWSYRLPLFIWALLVPEFILLWSIRQFIAAGEIREKSELVSLASQTSY
jgi:hypothetical protein